MLRMRLGTGQGSGAVLIERCAAASFPRSGLEWGKKKVLMNRQRAVKPVELQP